MAEIEWSPGIGDPSGVGWFTVLAYLLAAWLCLRAFMVEKSGPPRPYFKSIAALFRVMRRDWPRPPAPARRAALWLCLAATLGALGINKQLDLQTLVTEIGRAWAIEGGWYEDRRIVQAVFIGFVLAIGLVALAALTWLVRGHLSRFRLALGGMVFLVAFVVVRATSFHHVDVLIGTDLAGVRINWIFELSGIAMVGYAAALRIREAEAPVWFGWSKT